MTYAEGKHAKELATAAKPLIEYLHKYGGYALVSENKCVIFHSAESAGFVRVKENKHD